MAAPCSAARPSRIGIRARWPIVEPTGGCPTILRTLQKGGVQRPKIRQNQNPVETLLSFQDFGIRPSRAERACREVVELRTDTILRQWVTGAAPILTREVCLSRRATIER